MDFKWGTLLRIPLGHYSCAILLNCGKLGQPYGWGVLSDAAGGITARCIGIWLHRTCVAQNGNLAGIDCPCDQQESLEQSRRHSFGTAPEVRFGSALDRESLVEVIDAGEKGGECLAGTGRRSNENVSSRLNGMPSLNLNIGWSTDGRQKPFSDKRMELGKQHATECYHAQMTVLHCGCSCRRLVELER